VAAVGSVIALKFLPSQASSVISVAGSAEPTAATTGTGIDGGDDIELVVGV
jgi:hypothetical protein